MITWQDRCQMQHYINKMRNKMLISVIVPIYNTEKYLPACLESIIKQTYQEIEIILVDDGSMDGSLEICKDYAKLDTRIRIEKRNHQGLILTRKWGVEKSKGDYCIFVDSDDWIDKKLLEALVPLAESENIDVVNYLMKSIDNNIFLEWKNTIPQGIYENEDLIIIWKRMMFDLEQGCPGIIQSLCTKLMKRELLVKAMEDLDSRITMGEDAAVTYNIMLMAKKIAVIDNFFYFYRTRSDSMCRSKDINIFSRIYYFKEYMQNVFKKYDQSYRLYKQLNAYLMYFIEKGLDDLFSLRIRDLYRIPDCLYWEIKGKIILYGAGNVGKKYYGQLKCMKNVEIVAWVDQSLKGQQINCCKIESPEIIKKISFDRILIAVKDENVAEGIKKELKKYIKQEKILWEKQDNLWEKELILEE